MDKKYYTNSNTHPDDEVAKVKTFINELQAVQEKYYEQLKNSLRINSVGDDYLFDYIYNCPEESSKKTFSEYLEGITKNPYEEFVINKTKPSLLQGKLEENPNL